MTGWNPFWQKGWRNSGPYQKRAKRAALHQDGFSALPPMRKTTAGPIKGRPLILQYYKVCGCKAAFKHGVWTFFKVIFWALVFVGIGFIIVIFMRKQRIKKERQRELDALEEWKGDVRPDLIDFNAIFKRVLGDLSSYNLSPFAVQLLRDLDLDNLDYINDLDINKFDTNVIERHIGNAKDFIEEHGLNT